MSAEILRQAASLMCERAEAATSGPWEFRPRRGLQSMNDSPATIGFLDTAGYFVMFREGTWATESDMTYVASWHPAVALAVADWLDSEADAYDTCLAKQADPERRFQSLWTATANARHDHALTVARAYLGEAS